MNCLIFIAVLFCFVSSHYAADMVDTNNVTTIEKATTCKVTEYLLALQDDCKFGYDTIHGLWPDPETSCTSCTTEVFSESKLSSSTLSGMKKYWPTCQSGTNDDFWSHEWSKHGTCTGMTQDAYFSKALSLYTSYGSKCTTDCHLCFTPTFSYEGKDIC